MTLLVLALGAIALAGIAASAGRRPRPNGAR